ncbi:MAG: hypothetical protein ACPGXZ_00400, partial [Saprospiraceae bacterium]
MKKVLFFFCFLGISQFTTAQVFTPVELSYEYQLVSADEYEIRVIVDLDKKWCAYSMNLPEDGPIPTSLGISNSTNLKIIGTPKEKKGKGGKKVTGLDEMFDMDLTKYYGRAIFSVRCKVIDTTQPVKLELDFEYMTCDGE